MDGQVKVGLTVALAATLALAACEGGGMAGPGDAAGDMAAASPVSVARDAEAPEVFNVRSKGLWDGRPSLGGIWIAFAGVKEPERVMIRNSQNGKAVVGALFRREIDNPGPSLQVSSEAAEALGMLAGQPADLSVVALRREEKPVPPDAEIGAEDEPSPEPAPVTAPVTGPVPASAPISSGPLTPSPDTAAAEAPAARKSGGFFGFFRKKTPEDAEPGAAPAASAAAAMPAAVAATPPQPAPQPAPAGDLRRGYVQIGIFSVEANAGKAVRQLSDAGMAARSVADTAQDKTYWRVIVGPATSTAERDALAARVRKLGYPDAYPVTR